MSKNVNGIISWLRTWFDDIYAPKGTGGLTINQVYPIGSIYMTVNNVDPSLIFGGRWEKIQDKFLLASGATYNNGATGGEANHTLTINEMPSHNHSQSAHSHNAQSNAFLEASAGISSSSKRKMSYSSGDYYYPYSSSNVSFSRHTATGSATPAIQNNGGGASHNNMPPYIVVNVWKRLA